MVVRHSCGTGCLGELRQHVGPFTSFGACALPLGYYEPESTIDGPGALGLYPVKSNHSRKKDLKGGEESRRDFAGDRIGSVQVLRHGAFTPTR